MYLSKEDEDTLDELVSHGDFAGVRNFVLELLDTQHMDSYQDGYDEGYSSASEDLW